MTALIQAPKLPPQVAWIHDFSRSGGCRTLNSRTQDSYRVRVEVGTSHPPGFGESASRHGARIAERERNGNSSASQSRFEEPRDRRPDVDHRGDHEGAFASDF